jgi:alpha-galactosidase/6-phospho-beta-glucosidase family protein
MDREAPRFHWQIGGLLKDWQKSGISSIDIKKVRFELYGVHHVKFFPKSGITTREEETECMTRFNARMSEKPYQMDGVGPVWIKYFSRDEAPPCQGCEKSSERRVIEHGPGEEEDEGTGSGEGESDEESDREDYEDEESEEDEEEESDDEKDKEDYEDEESEEDDGESAGSDQPSQ